MSGEGGGERGQAPATALQMNAFMPQDIEVDIL